LLLGGSCCLFAARFWPLPLLLLLLLLPLLLLLLCPQLHNGTTPICFLACVVSTDYTP
jgi:hypothetical protein